MHEFDRCKFCETSDVNGKCADIYCVGYCDYIMDVKKIINKADEMGVTIADIIALIKECNDKE